MAVKPYDNVPVLSWLMLRGRCRNCSNSISARYPLVEALTALLCVGAVLAGGSAATIALNVTFILLLVPIALIDVEHRIIPNKLTALGAVLALAIGTALDPSGEPARLIAGAAAGGALLLAALAYPGGMGMGDVKLAGVMGLFLGSAVASAMLVALLAGVLFGAPRGRARGTRRRARPPFRLAPSSRSGRSSRCSPAVRSSTGTRPNSSADVSQATWTDDQRGSESAKAHLDRGRCAAGAARGRRRHARDQAQDALDSKPNAESQAEGGRSRSGSTLVGLDIQPGYVSAVQARVNGSILVQRAAGAPLPPDTVREGEVLDGAALAETLREMFHDSRLDKRVRVGSPISAPVLRTLELPPLTDRKELDRRALPGRGSGADAARQRRTRLPRAWRDRHAGRTAPTGDRRRGPARHDRVCSPPFAAPDFAPKASTCPRSH